LWKLLIIGNRRSGDKTQDRIYPLIGYITQSYQNGVLSLSNVLSLITKRDKPLSFFGRNINWMTPGLISKVVKKFLLTKEFDTTLIPIQDRFFAEVNSVCFKVKLIHDVKKLHDHVMNFPLIPNRLNILDRLITSPQLREFYKY